MGAASPAPADAARPPASPFASYMAQRVSVNSAAGVGPTAAAAPSPAAAWGTPIAASSPAPRGRRDAYMDAPLEAEPTPLQHVEPVGVRPFYTSHRDEWRAQASAAAQAPPPVQAQPQYQQTQMQTQMQAQMQAQQIGGSSAAFANSTQARSAASPPAASAAAPRTGVVVLPRAPTAGGVVTAAPAAGQPGPPDGETYTELVHTGVRAAGVSALYDESLQQGHPDQVVPGNPKPRKKKGWFGKKTPDALPPDQVIMMRAMPQTPTDDWSPLHSDMHTLLQDPVYADVTFYVEGQAVRAHKCILAARSTTFLEMFRETGATEFDIPNVSHTAFAAILSFIYLDRTHVTLKLAMDLLSALSTLRIATLKDMCESFLIANICVENAAWMLQGAVLHGAARVLEHATEFIVANFDEVARTKAFQELDRAPIVQIIRERGLRRP